MTNIGNKSNCPTNINSKERTLRIMAGFFMLMLSAVIWGMINRYGLARGWRFVLIGPYYLAGLGFFQAHKATCVRLAAQGLRKLDSGVEKINDTEEITVLRRIATGIKIKSVIAAVVLTLLSFLA
jgi:hypothetical protein